MASEPDEVLAARLAAIQALTAAKEEGAERKAAAQALASAKEAVRETQAEFFALLGINIANVDDVMRFRDDIAFMRNFHSNARKIGGRFVFGIISAVMGALAIGAWEFFKMLLHSIK